MIYCIYFSGHGRGLLADELDAEDPFSLVPADILKRVLALGYTAAVDHPMTDPWPHAGIATEVERDGRKFIVTVSQNTGDINVEELRSAPYERAE